MGKYARTGRLAPRDCCVRGTGCSALARPRPRRPGSAHGAQRLHTLALHLTNDLKRFQIIVNSTLKIADDTALVFESETWDQARRYAEQAFTYNVIS